MDRRALGAADVSDEQPSRSSGCCSASLYATSARCTSSRSTTTSRDHHRWPLVGQRHVHHVRGAVPDVRQARAVVGAARRTSSSCPRSSARSRSAGVPWRTEPEVYRTDLARAAPGRPHDAPRARRHRPRRRCRRHLARGGPGARRGVGPGALRARGVPPRTARRQPHRRTARRPRAHPSGPRALHDRPAGGAGGADADGRRALAAPAVRRVRRRAAPGCVRRPRAGRAGRRGGRPALRCSATATPAPTTCWPASGRRRS